jgi:hypothetical protein
MAASPGADDRELLERGPALTARQGRDQPSQPLWEWIDEGATVFSY